jgi:hypothetical protein
MTWLCITALNLYLVITDIRRGRRAAALLPAAFTIGSTAVAVLSMRHGTYSLGPKEYVIAAGVLLAIALGKRWGMWAACGALLLSGVPQALKLFESGDLSASWLWSAGLLTGAISFMASKNRDPEDLSFPGAVALYNLMMLLAPFGSSA